MFPLIIVNFNHFFIQPAPECNNFVTRTAEQSNFPTDHYIIEFQVRQTFRRANPVPQNVYDYKRGNFDELRSFLTHNPFEDFSSENIDKCWLQWKKLFMDAVHKFIPVKIVKDVNSPPWIDGEVTEILYTKEIFSFEEIP